MPTPQSEDSSKEPVSEKPNSSQAKNSRKSDNQPQYRNINNVSARSINLTIKQNRVINEFQIDHQSLEKPKLLKKSTSFSGLPLSVVGENRI